VQNILVQDIAEYAGSVHCTAEKSQNERSPAKKYVVFDGLNFFHRQTDGPYKFWGLNKYLTNPHREHFEDIRSVT
jgi:hypothetical protein